MAIRRALLTMDIFNAPVTTHYFVSISLVIWSKLLFAMETFIVPMTGRVFLEPIIARYRSSDILRFFRGDAGFADPEIYRFLEFEDYSYVIRLKGNNILQGHITHLLTRHVGRPRITDCCVS